MICAILKNKLFLMGLPLRSLILGRWKVPLKEQNEVLGSVIVLNVNNCFGGFFHCIIMCLFKQYYDN